MPLELKVNKKIRVRYGDHPGFVMIVQRIEGERISASMHWGSPSGGSYHTFRFYLRDGEYWDGTGKRLIVEPFRRTKAGV